MGGVSGEYRFSATMRPAGLVVLRELLASGDWLIPTKNNQIYLQKPPLFTWFGAVFGHAVRKPCRMGFATTFSVKRTRGITWLLFFRLKRACRSLGCAVRVRDFGDVLFFLIQGSSLQN